MISARFLFRFEIGVLWDGPGLDSVPDLAKIGSGYVGSNVVLLSSRRGRRLGGGRERINESSLIEKGKRYGAITA